MAAPEFDLGRGPVQQRCHERDVGVICPSQTDLCRAQAKNFVLALLMVFTPWSIINLTDFYLISKDRFDIPAFYDLKGRYGKWNWRALVAYGVGVVVQIPFLAQSFYTGPMVEKLGGADISWIVGIVVTFLLYFFMLRNRSVAPSETIYPDVEALDAQRSRG
ncbi:MAG: cytosine permease [Brevibacterium aurantiacum]|uniref:cytosine permease n=2 Tax=Brevibacterium aurantiacum TaxID=273384 RepID=UPI0021632F66|nr:cytosine permease [Brevibacterium aurantiacum]